MKFILTIIYIGGFQMWNWSEIKKMYLQYRSMSDFLNDFRSSVTQPDIVSFIPSSSIFTSDLISALHSFPPRQDKSRGESWVHFGTSLTRCNVLQLYFLFQFVCRDGDWTSLDLPISIFELERRKWIIEHHHVVCVVCHVDQQQKSFCFQFRKKKLIYDT